MFSKKHLYFMHVKNCEGLDGFTVLVLSFKDDFFLTSLSFHNLRLRH